MYIRSTLMNHIWMWILSMMHSLLSIFDCSQLSGVNIWSSEHRVNKSVQGWRKVLEFQGSNLSPMKFQVSTSNFKLIVLNEFLLFLDENGSNRMIIFFSTIIIWINDNISFFILFFLLSWFFFYYLYFDFLFIGFLWWFMRTWILYSGGV
jgi:hypothetical protein